jgi:hypothetical protein
MSPGGARSPRPPDGTARCDGEPDHNTVLACSLDLVGEVELGIIRSPNAKPGRVPGGVVRNLCLIRLTMVESPTSSPSIALLLRDSVASLKETSPMRQTRLSFIALFIRLYFG